MAIDTASMRNLVVAAPMDQMRMSKDHLRKLIDEAPGDSVVVGKDQILSLLGVVELGRIADQLAGMSDQVRSMAMAA